MVSPGLFIRPLRTGRRRYSNYYLLSKEGDYLFPMGLKSPQGPRGITGLGALSILSWLFRKLGILWLHVIALTCSFKSANHIVFLL